MLLLGFSFNLLLMLISILLILACGLSFLSGSLRLIFLFGRSLFRGLGFAIFRSRFMLTFLNERFQLMKTSFHPTNSRRQLFTLTFARPLMDFRHGFFPSTLTPATLGFASNYNTMGFDLRRFSSLKLFMLFVILMCFYWIVISS